MIIHQITDLHIPDDERVTDEQYAEVRQNVIRQLRFIDEKQPDLLVVSGDLTMNDGCESGCRWLREHLPDVPRVVIPGNHDDAGMIERLFGRWPWLDRYDDCSIIFLDTSPDLMNEEDMVRLQSVESDSICILFMHHPPHLIGDGFMSINQPLLNHAAAAEAIRGSIANHVFCGHYHNEAYVQCDGFELFLTPSPAFQIDLEVVPFTMQEFQPSVRIITVEDGQVSTELRYV